MARIENLYLFLGENAWEKAESLRSLKKGRECLLFEGEEKGLNPEKILSELLTIPFESRPRLIVIRDIEKTPSTFQSRLLETLPRLPQKTVCVLEAKGLAPEGPFFEKISSLAKVTFFKEPKGTALLSWIDHRASFYGKKISPVARILLLEKGGGVLFALDKALEALSTYLGESPFIEEKDVNALMGVSLTHTSFELARAVASRQALKALMILDRLLSERGTLQEILGAVGWQLRRMLRAKELLEEGVSPRELGRHLRLRWENEKEFLESLSRFERVELEKGLTQLLGVDRNLKTGKAEGREEVERFVLDLCR